MKKKKFNKKLKLKKVSVANLNKIKGGTLLREFPTLDFTCFIVCDFMTDNCGPNTGMSCFACTDPVNCNPNQTQFPC